MKKIQIDPATQRRPTSRKQNRSARIKEQLTQQVEVQVIPAKADMEGYERPKPRVCAYCRVSTDMDTQALSYELQVQNYTDYITSNPDWEFAGIYADKGISGTSLRHRDDFNRMIADCEAGKIDLIVTKAVTRFARNVVDAISTVRKLKQLSPPVGVYFETERINTLDTTSETYLGLISLFAQGESESKSESLKWSYIRRWKRGTGIYPTWSLLGYEVDEEGHWVIVEIEAELIRVIYDMYLNGHSSPQIAEILTRSGIPTATNKSVWSSGAVLGMDRRRKRAVAYVRVSTASSAQLHSYEFQEQYWHDKLDSDPNVELVHIYADLGISGSSMDKRPQLLAMMRDAHAGKFDIIYTKSVSRFARNTIELLEAVRELRDIGVEVVFEKENIRSSDPTSELMLTVAATIAEDDLKVDSERQRWSFKRRFENGWISIGNGMYGYRMLEDNTLEIVPEEAAVVQRIFEMYIDGAGSSAIAATLDREGIPSRIGKGWRPQTILEMLANGQRPSCSITAQKSPRHTATAKQETNPAGIRRRWCDHGSNRSKTRS